MKCKSKTALIGAGLIFLAGAGWSDTNANEAFMLEPLRDPFWPVGYLPDDWQTEQTDEQKHAATTGTDWDAPTAQIRVNGTSRLGRKTVAIINGDLKEVGDLIEVSYGGRIYQWELKEIDPSGQVHVDRIGVHAATIGFHPGDKK